MGIPDSFEKLTLIDVRPVVLGHNLVFTGWLGFHKNTEFKMRSGVYHIKRFDRINEEYWKVQGAPDAQSIYNHDHPLKEVLFFEFFAAAATLLGCVDSLFQEVNCAFQLGLSPTRENGKTEVSLASVRTALKARTPVGQTLARLDSLETDPANAWFRFLRRLRNTALHADLYSSSSEMRNVNEIIRRIESKEGSIHTKEDLLKEVKRDVVFRLDKQDIYITGTIHAIAEETFKWIDASYREIESDLDSISGRRT